MSYRKCEKYLEKWLKQEKERREKERKEKNNEDISGSFMNRLKL